ncbi:MAG: hypothetical protein OXG65_10590 [Chloroflexi bacterium]|nr:hypothetical protein [Chloroflexota bacterium]
MDPHTIQLSASTTIFIRFMLAVLVAAAMSLVFARESNACLPPPVGSPTEELRKASVVFAGKVIAASSVPNGRIYEFKVYTVWKGPIYEKVLILRSVGVYDKGTPCEGEAKQYTVGKEYLVYDDIGMDSRTNLLHNANEDLVELGEGQRPIPGSIAPVPPDVSEASASEARRQTGVSVIVALAAIAIGIQVLRRLAIRLHKKQSES